MAASGVPLLGQRPLHTSRVKLSGPVLVVAQFGARTSQRPTQAVFHSLYTRRRQASASPVHGRRRSKVHGRQLVVHAVAMVNVDFASPSLLLGTALIGCGVLLLNLRNFQNKVSRDADIVVAAMVSIVGSTLIFQGWRLDPLLLLCQALTTSVAFWYGLETFRLRSKEADMAPPQLPPGVGPDPASMEAAQQYYQQQGGVGYPIAGAPFLPPGGEPYYPWAVGQEAAASTSTSGRADGQSPYSLGSPSSSPYTETIQYDYYGNPIMPQEPTYNAAAFNPYGTAYGTPDDSYGAAEADAAYGGTYAAAAPSASQGGGYDGRGMPTGPGPSYGGPSAPGGPYVPQAGGSPHWQQQGQFSLPPATNGSGASVGPRPELPYSGPYGSGNGASSPGGSAATPGYDGAGGPSWAGQAAGEARGAPGAGGVSGRGQPGRLDLYEKVDDWE